MPFVGGFLGMLKAKPWGYLQSSIGRAIFYLSAGLFSWGAGGMIWAYYNFFEEISAPYPSFADIGFILAIPLWIIGIVNLSRATGAKFGLKQMKGRIYLIAIPIVVTLISYYLLIVVAREGNLVYSLDNYFEMFFDLAYPLGDVAVLTVALLIFGLSFNYFGGRYKLAIAAIIIGFILMYVADFVFSYTTTVETFYNGNWGDYLFTLALFFITFGAVGFDPPTRLTAQQVNKSK